MARGVRRGTPGYETVCVGTRGYMWVHGASDVDGHRGGLSRGGNIIWGLRAITKTAAAASRSGSQKRHGAASLAARAGLDAEVRSPMALSLVQRTRPPPRRDAARLVLRKTSTTNAQTHVRILARFHTMRLRRERRSVMGGERECGSRGRPPVAERASPGAFKKDRS